MRWEVRATGPRTGAPLLLLHGFTGRGISWAPLARRMVALGRNVIVVDLPGHGRTGGTATNPQDATVERTADDLAEILDNLHAAPADVIGYSLGARIALRLAVAHPAAVNRLVLESPSAGIADPGARSERRDADERLAQAIERDGIERFVADWERNPVFASHAATMRADRADRQRRIRLANRPTGLSLSLRGAGQGAMEPLHERLAAIEARTLVIAGTLDTIGLPRARAVAAAIPGATLREIANAGHTPHDEQPIAFTRLVTHFLAGDPVA